MDKIKLQQIDKNKEVPKTISFIIITLFILLIIFIGIVSILKVNSDTIKLDKYTKFCLENNYKIENANLVLGPSVKCYKEMDSIRYSYYVMEDKNNKLYLEKAK